MNILALANTTENQLNSQINNLETQLIQLESQFLNITNFVFYDIQQFLPYLLAGTIMLGFIASCFPCILCKIGKNIPIMIYKILCYITCRKNEKQREKLQEKLDEKEHRLIMA